MFKISTIIPFLIAVFLLCNAELKAMDKSLLTPSEVVYKNNILKNTSSVLSIKEKFGRILELGDIYYSYKVSKEVVEELDKIGNKLDTIEVPQRMVIPYNVFLESIKDYRKSAACIRNATEIILGYFDGSEEDVFKLLKMSNHYAERANLYLELSMSLHSQAFNKINKNLKRKSTNNTIPNEKGDKKDNSSVVKYPESEKIIL